MAYLVLPPLAALVAVKTYSSSDIPVIVFVLAVLWFIVPLARAPEPVKPDETVSSGN